MALAATILSACADPTTSASEGNTPSTAPVLDVTPASTPTINLINSGGGADAQSLDGLKIWTWYGSYQINRANKRQIYFSTGRPDALRFGLYTEDGFISWEDATSSPWWGWWRKVGGTSSCGFGVFPAAPCPLAKWTQASHTLEEVETGVRWKNTEVLSATVNGKTYGMTVITDYVKPNLFAEVSVTLSLPSGLTLNPHLYLASDFYLDGSDKGPGLTGTLRSGRRYVVQYRVTGADTIVGGVLETVNAADKFTSWMEGSYQDVFGRTQYGPGGTLGTESVKYPNSVLSDPNTDAGVGAHWDLGTPPESGSWNASRNVILYFAIGLPKESAEIVTVTGDNKTVTYGNAAPTYTYTLKDGEGNTWTPPDGWTEPTCTSNPVYTTSTPVGSSIAITCSGAAADGFAFEYTDGALTINKVTPTLTWTGSEGLVTGSTITLSATPSLAACTGEISYTVNGMPASSPYTIPAGESLLEIEASYGGNTNCEGATVSTVVVVAVPGATTTGGGVYRASGSGAEAVNGGTQRINFGHTVQKTETTNKRAGTTTTVYRGQLLWMVTERWRFKGSVYSSSANGDAPAFVTFPCPSSPKVGTEGSNPKCGLITGTGVLQQWNGSGWTNVGAQRTFTATIYDGGLLTSCKGRNNCTSTLLADYFGFAISGEIPAGVPVSVPQPLQTNGASSRNGNIVIR